MFRALLVASLLLGSIAPSLLAQPPIDAAYLHSVQERSRQLMNDLDYLQHDISAALRGPRGRELADLAAASHQRALQFHRALREGAVRHALYRDFKVLDEMVHKLLDRLEAFGTNDRSLQRAAARVHNSDQQLHYALNAGDVTPERGPDVITRQVRLLAQQSTDLAGTIDWATHGSAAGERMRQGGAALVAASQHLRQAVDRGFDPEHVRRDFRRVAEAWTLIVAALNAPEATPGQLLLTRANQTYETIERLRQGLNVREPFIRPRGY